MKHAHTTTPRRRSSAAVPVVPAPPRVAIDLSGHVRVIAQPAANPQRAREAAEAIRRLGALHKPSKKHGAAAAIRELRDGGD